MTDVTGTRKRQGVPTPFRREELMIHAESERYHWMNMAIFNGFNGTFFCDLMDDEWDTPSGKLWKMAREIVSFPIKCGDFP